MRPRIPFVIQAAQGNKSKHSRKTLKAGIETETAVTPGAPDMPTDLPESVHREWGMIVAELDRLNMLAHVDGMALEAALRAVAQARLADAEIAKVQERMAGAKVPDRDDYYLLSILMAASKKAWTQYKAFCTEFGLTPAARSRLSGSATQQTKKVDEIEEALCG